MRKSYECYVRLESISKKTGKAYKKWHFVGWSPLPNLETYNWKEMYMKGEYLIIVKHDGEFERYLVGEGFDEVAEFNKMKREREQFAELGKYIQNFYSLLDDSKTPENVLEATQLVIDEYEALKKKWGEN